MRCDHWCVDKRACFHVGRDPFHPADRCDHKFLVNAGPAIPRFAVELIPGRSSEERDRNSDIGVVSRVRLRDT